MFEVWYEMKSAFPPDNQNTKPEKSEKASLTVINTGIEGNIELQGSRESQNRNREE